MTTARPRRVRAFAVAAAVGLALWSGGQTPATAEPSDSGSGSHSVDAPSSGGDSGGSDSGGSGSGDSGGSGSGGSDSGGSDSGGSGSDSGGSGSGSGDSGSGSGDSGPADPGTDTGTTPESDPDEPSGDITEDVIPVNPDPPTETEDSSAGEPVAPPATETTEPAPEPAADSTSDTSAINVDVHENPTPGKPDPAREAGSDATLPPAVEGVPADPRPAARAGGAIGAQFGAGVSPSGDPPPWSPMLKTSTPPVAVAPQPYKTGAFGLLAFLGINILGGGSTGAVSPAPWTLLWWIRRFGTPGPAATAESHVGPYTTGLVTADAAAPDRFREAADGPDINNTATNSPVPQYALVGSLVLGSALLTRNRMAEAVTLAGGPPATIPAPRPAHTAPASAPESSGVLLGSMTLTDPDGNPIPTTLLGVTPTSDQTFLTASGSVLTYDAPTGMYTYTPCLPARVAAAAPGAPESARFDSVVITADDGRGGTTPVTVSLPITTPYALGQVTVPGCQVDEVVLGHDGAAFVTTRRGDGRTQLSVVRPKTTTVASVPIAGSPTEFDRGAVLGPDGRAHQLTELSEISGESIRTSVSITRVDSSGVLSTTGPIIGVPADHLRFDDAGVGHLLTTWSDEDGRTYTSLTVVDHHGTASTFPRIPGAGGRLVLSASGKVFVSTSDADGTLLYEVGASGLRPAGRVFDGEGGDLWARRGDSLYFVRHRTGTGGTPVATLAIRHPDGSITDVDEIPGRVSSVVPTATVVYVVSRSPDSVHVSRVRADGGISTERLAGTCDAAVAGPGDRLYLALMDLVTGENSIVEISPDGIRRVVAEGVGQVFVRAHESGAVLLTTTNTTPDGEDTTTITAVHGNSTVDGARVDGTPISVHFDRTGAAHLPMLITDPETGDPLVSLAVVRPDAQTVVSAPVAGEPAGDPAIAHDGRTYLPLTRFCPETRWPKTTLVMFCPGGTAVEVAEFDGHSTHGPVITPDNDVILLTHDAGSTTIRPIRMTVDDGREPGNPAPAMVFDVTPTISDINPETGAVSGSVATAADDAGTLSHLTTDSQVELDSAGGTFVFTPTASQRHAATGSTLYDFAVLVSDTSGSSTVISVRVPIVPANALETLE